MPGAAEAMNGAAHDGKEDPSFIVGRLKEQAAFCEHQSHQVCAAPHLPAGILSPYSDRGEGALSLMVSPIIGVTEYFAEDEAQNGLTMTSTTMTIISNVGISLTIRQCFAGFSLRSSANLRTAPAR
jgi:hypothetical protein